MEARQMYYLKIYKNKFNFIETTLEAITKNDGAKEFLSNLGINSNNPILPPKINQNIIEENVDLVSIVNEIYNSISINIEEIVDEFIKSGKSLS